MIINLNLITILQIFASKPIKNASLLTFDKKWILFKAFCKSQFKYCPLTWKFYNRRTNNRISKSHERALGLTYDDYETSLSDLLAKYGSFTVHPTNIQTLLLEMYKIKQLIWKLFHRSI